MKQNNQDISVSGNWFYMNSNEVTIRSLYNAICKDSTLDTEIWEELGIMEVNVTEKSSIDFEQLKPYFRDKNDDAFLKQKNIHTLYMVTFDEADYKTARSVFETILAQCQGFFVEDTAEFTNIIE